MAKKDQAGRDNEGTEAGFVLKAPVVVDAKTKKGVGPLLDFVAGLRTNRNAVIAAAENDRLRPYFRALSLYLRAQLKGDQKDPDNQKIRKLSDPRALSGLFNAMAAYSRNTLTSEMAIAPDSIMNEGPAAHLFGAQYQFQVEYKHGDFRFHVGFFQVRADTQRTREESSVTFPLFLLDKKIAERLEERSPESLLKEFQAVFTLVNHDMLHHFTSPVINSAIAGKYGADSSALNRWGENLPRGNHSTEAYEDWAQVSHEQVLIETAGSGKKERIADVEKRIDSFFDELTRIGQEIAKQKPKSKKDDPEKTAHETVDYMGMAMAHALSRVFPLDHPVMQRCLDRLQAADPMPEESLADLIKPKLRSGWALEKEEKYPVDPGKFVRERCVAGETAQAIVSSYKEAGLDILCTQEPKISYRGVKMLQLINMAHEEVLRHAPRLALGPMREKAAGAMVEMVQIAAKTIGFKPSAGKKHS